MVSDAWRTQVVVARRRQCVLKMSRANSLCWDSNLVKCIHHGAAARHGAPQYIDRACCHTCDVGMQQVV
jgi:hypothetical protein